MRGNRLLSGLDPLVVQRFEELLESVASNNNVDYISQ